jgi:hypothetical protein
MLYIAITGGVCCGIMAAISAMSWLGGLAEWREEQRERRAVLKVLRGNKRPVKE